MSWHPNDLVSDADLVAYEPTIFSAFGRVEWAEKRQKALEDWLWPSLLTRGLDPERLRTRVQPAQVWSFQGSTYTDRTAAAISQTADDVVLGTWLTSTSDALYVGSAGMFRGLSLRVADLPSSATATISVEVWQDAWTPIAIVDGTQETAGKSCSRGGAITWRLPAGWVVRSVHSSDPRYWVRLKVSAALTATARAGQLAVIRRSVFCAPVTYKTLEWIFRAAPTSQEGPWREKADFYADAAETALQRALQAGGGEFDTLTEDDVLDPDETAQTIEEAGGAVAWTLERG